MGCRLFKMIHYTQYKRDAVENGEAEKACSYIT